MFGALITGVFGATTFSFYAKKNGQTGVVDIPAAIALSGTAMVVTPISARAVLNLPEKFLLRTLGGFTIFSGLMVLMKPIQSFLEKTKFNSKTSKQEFFVEFKDHVTQLRKNPAITKKTLQSSSTPSPSPSSSSPLSSYTSNSLFFQSFGSALWLLGMGCLTGISVGLFGIGGGVIMVPSISVLGDQKTALGEFALLWRFFFGRDFLAKIFPEIFSEK